MNIRTSSATPGGYGNQATYDIKGNLITSGVAAGSADYVKAGGLGQYLAGHRDYDVKPFILGARLDGNSVKSITPVYYTGSTTILGNNLQKYFEVRPVLAD